MELLSETERRIHMSLYENVHLLSTAFDNPKIFDGTRLQNHLRRDMFLRANKFVFEQIIYFLLNVIDTELLKTVPWPLFDKKLESQFRREVKKILMNLNSKYENARIPPIQTSHMITPGGIKVVRILWSLSELAILEYLQKSNTDKYNNDCLLLPFTVNLKTASNQLQNANAIVEYEYQKVFENYHEIETKIEEVQIEAHKYSSQLLPLGEDVEQLKETLKNTTDTTINLDFTQFIEQMSKNLKELKEYEILIEQNKDVINATVTSIEDSGFTYEIGSLNITKGIARKILNNHKELHMMEFLTLIDDVLKEFIICIKQQPIFDLSELEELSLKIIKDYETFLYKFESIHIPELQQLNTILRDNIDKYNEEILIKFNKSNSFFNQLQQITPDIEFNLPSISSDRKICTTKFPSTSSIRSHSLFETLTTLKKRNRKLNTVKKSTSSSTVKRNLIPDSINSGEKCKRDILQSIENITSSIIEQNETEKLSSTIVNTKIPNATSTPELSKSASSSTSSSSGRKYGIPQLLTCINQSPSETDSSNNLTLNISKEIFDVMDMDDELNSSQIFFNVE